MAEHSVIFKKNWSYVFSIAAISAGRWPWRLPATAHLG